MQIRKSRSERFFASVKSPKGKWKWRKFSCRHLFFSYFARLPKSSETHRVRFIPSMNLSLSFFSFFHLCNKYTKVHEKLTPRVVGGASSTALLISPAERPEGINKVASLSRQPVVRSCAPQPQETETFCLLFESYFADARCLHASASNFNLFIQAAQNNLPELKLHFVQPRKHPELLVSSEDRWKHWREENKGRSKQPFHTAIVVIMII